MGSLRCLWDQEDSGWTCGSSFFPKKLAWATLIHQEDLSPALGHPRDAKEEGVRVGEMSSCDKHGRQRTPAPQDVLSTPALHTHL
jgi:hypothetical protein